MGNMRNAYKVSIGKYERKTWFGKAMRRQDDNVIIHLKERGGECELDSFRSENRPMACFCEHRNKLSFSIKYEKFLD
jgi:hypothetical protein